MTDIQWDEWQGGNGDWPDKWKPEQVGAHIAGIVTKLRVATMGDGTRLPELTIRKDDGVENTVLASQVRLQSKLAELRPKAGDRIAIVYSGDEPATRPGRSPAKLFQVELKRADDGAVPAAPVAAPTEAVSAADLL